MYNQYSLQFYNMVAFVATLHCNIIDVAFYCLVHSTILRVCSWKIVLISHWYVYPTFFNLKSITVMQYTPNGILKNVCILSSGYILAWLYIKTLSIKDILSTPHVLSIMTSVIGRGNSSLDKQHSDHRNRCKLFFLGTRMMLDTQSGRCSSLTKSESMNFLTSDSIASMFSRLNHHCCCLTGFTSGLMLRPCIGTCGSRPGMSS